MGTDTAFVGEVGLSTNESVINPYIFIDKLFSHFDANERIVCGNGSACVITFQACKIQQGQRMFTNSGCASMGYCIPAAIGVAALDNSKRTICIDGDGSFMMNLQELATIMQNKLNLKIILLNNNGYHSIRQTQTNLFDVPLIGVDSGSGVGFPNFELLSAAFGISYYTIQGEYKCDEIIEEALNREGPCIIEVMVDPTQNFVPKSSSKVLEDGRVISPTLDDMAPFLERTEYENIYYRG